jgi:hypothetical protein
MLLNYVYRLAFFIEGNSMFLFFLSFLSLSGYAQWDQEGAVSCNFGMGAPFVFIEFSVSQDFKPLSPAKINFSGAKKQLSAEEENVTSGNEWKRIALGKDDPRNALTIILLNVDNSPIQKRAVLLNPNFAFLNRLNGVCDYQMTP